MAQWIQGVCASMGTRVQILSTHVKSQAGQYVCSPSPEATQRPGGSDSVTLNLPNAATL